MIYLLCENLSLSYDGRTVVSNLTFTVSKGDYLCVIGENGSGKSTLIQAILKLKPPSGGQLTLGGGLDRREIGYLPQQTDMQRDFPASVREIVRSGCIGRAGSRPFYNRRETALAETYMEKLGISGIAKRCYSELSGGQQQRVLLARAFCAARRLLVLDEPAAGLDPHAASDMYDSIKKQNESGITVIMVTHDLPACLNCATHILHIGNSVFFGTKTEFLSSETGRVYAGLEGELS